MTATRASASLATRILTPLAIVATLTLAGCAPEPGTPPAGGDTPAATEGSDSGADKGGDGGTDKGSGSALDADGRVVPGQVVTLKMGDSVTYYSMPSLTKEDVQKVTIHSVEYIELADLGPEAPAGKLTSGVLLIDLSWEEILGSVQSNQGYLIATLDSGEEGIPWAFREDRMRNGGVKDGPIKTGTFTIELDRGKTTLTLVDYEDTPVATLFVDTSR